MTRLSSISSPSLRSLPLVGIYSYFETSERTASEGRNTGSRIVRPSPNMGPLTSGGRIPYTSFFKMNTVIIAFPLFGRGVNHKPSVSLRTSPDGSHRDPVGYRRCLKLPYSIMCLHESSSVRETMVTVPKTTILT